MKRGEIWIADLDPIQGQEQAGIRPVVVVSGTAINNYTTLVMVCPITSSVKNMHGCVLIEKTIENNLTKDSEILVNHFRTISKKRLKKLVGYTNEEIIKLIHQNINYFLEF